MRWALVLTMALAACSRRNLDARHVAVASMATVDPYASETTAEPITYAERIEAILSARASGDAAVIRARAALADDLGRVRACDAADWLFVRAKTDGDLAALAEALRHARKAPM